jgi:hypothetical protein
MLLISMEVEGNMINVTVTKSSVSCSGHREELTAGRVGLIVSASFSSEWDGLTKTAVVIGSGHTLDVAVDKTGAFTIPHECMSRSGGPLKIGLCGMNADGTVVIPTVYCTLGVIQEGAMPTEQTGEDPTPSAINQMMAWANEAVEKAQAAQTSAAESALEASRAANTLADSAATATDAADRAQTAIDIIAGLAQTPLPVIISATAPNGPALWFDTSLGSSSVVSPSDDDDTMTVSLSSDTDNATVTVLVDDEEYAVTNASVDQDTKYSFEIL